MAAEATVALLPNTPVASSEIASLSSCDFVLEAATDLFEIGHLQAGAVMVAMDLEAEDVVAVLAVRLSQRGVPTHHPAVLVGGQA